MTQKRNRKMHIICLLVLGIILLLSACTQAAKNAGPSAVSTQEPAQESTAEAAADTEEGRTLAEGEAIANSFAEFCAAAQDAAITTLYVDSDISIDEDFIFERNNDLAIFIGQGVTLTINAGFTPVLCALENDGAIIISGTFDHACNLVNNGTVTVKSGGMASSGMTSITNNGDFTVEEGGSLLVERGTQFINTGVLTNSGHISVGDGGSLDNQAGSIVNNGTLDISSFFTGDIAGITGTGTVNDNRE